MISYKPIGDDILEVQVNLPASPERVYRAWTEASELAHWFRGSHEGHLEIHEFDCRDGGGYDLTMVNPNGDRYHLAGTYLKLEPSRRIEMTWTWKFDGETTPPSTVSLDLKPLGEGTLLIIRHEKFMSADDRDNHQSGWEPCLQNLEAYLGGEA